MNPISVGIDVVFHELPHIIVKYFQKDEQWSCIRVVESWSDSWPPSMVEFGEYQLSRSYTDMFYGVRYRTISLCCCCCWWCCCRLDDRCKNDRLSNSRLNDRCRSRLSNSRLSNSTLNDRCKNRLSKRRLNDRCRNRLSNSR